MKLRSIIFLCVVFCLCGKSYSQNEYYDARRLKDMLTGQVLSEDAAPILIKYFKIDTGSIDNANQMRDSINAALAKNPFLKDYRVGSMTKSSIGKDIKGIFSDIGSFNVTNIADGIAQFLIKRGQEELNAAFFSRMKKFFEAHEECVVLFPATVDFLSNLEPHQYAEFIQSLREVFQKDLSNLLVHLNQLIDLPKYQELLRNLPEIRVSIRSAKIVAELTQSDGGIMPDSVIYQLSMLSEWEEIHPNLGNGWKLLQAVSHSVRHLEPGDGDKDPRRWITLSDMNALIQDHEATRLFFGLFYQSVEGIQFLNNENQVATVQAFMAANAGQILHITGLVENFVILANDVDLTIKEVREKKESNSFTNDDYYSYINKCINITEYGFKVANTIRPGIVDGDKYIDIAKHVNDAYKNIYTKDYGAAINNVCAILEQIFSKSEELGAEKIKRKGLTGTDQTNLMAAVSNKSLPDGKFVATILKYGNFMASVIKAESPSDVQSAIEAAALPAGSYTIKQQSSFNLSLNGYIGYAFDFNGGLYARGIYAPIGFSASTGLWKSGGALTLFASFIDVGGIASYRIDNGITDSLKQEVRLESILSPSAQLMFEFPKLPIAICAGWRRTPKLFYSKQEGFTTVLPKNVFNLAVLIDIPIFTIINHAKPK